MTGNFFATLAASMTGISFLPQVIKVIKTKSTKDISLLMFLIFSLGVGLWLIYGILINSWPMIILDACELPLCIIILGYKIKYK